MGISLIRDYAHHVMPAVKLARVLAHVILVKKIFLSSTIFVIKNVQSGILLIKMVFVNHAQRTVTLVKTPKLVANVSPKCFIF